MHDESIPPVAMSELQLAASAARKFYLDGLSRVEIGAELGVSRFKVARLLDLARSEKLVTIEVRDPRNIDAALSESLRDLLGIRRVIVVAHETDRRNQIGAVAADYLQETVKARSSIGLAWSRTTQALAENLGSLPPCTIVQLCGVVASATIEEQNVELVRRAAHQAGVAAVTFYAPLLVPDPGTAATLRKDPGIADALARCNNLSTAIIAVGLWATGESTLFDALPAHEAQDLARRGAVAETCGILLDAHGQLLDGGLNDRTIAVSAEQLRNTPDVVALAVNPSRAAAVLALARSGLISTLITHRDLARSLLLAEDSSADRAQPPWTDSGIVTSTDADADTTEGA